MGYVVSKVKGRLINTRKETGYGLGRVVVETRIGIMNG